MFTDGVLKETVNRGPAITLKTIVLFCSRIRHSQGLERRSRLLLKVPLKDKRYYGIFVFSRNDERIRLVSCLPHTGLADAVTLCPARRSTSGGWLHQAVC